MQIQETLSRLDTLLHQCKLDEAEVCLTQAIAQAQAEQDMESEKMLSLWQAFPVSTLWAARKSTAL